MSEIEIYDERMRALVSSDSPLEKLASGAVHSEGPVYLHDSDSVIWSDAHGNRLFCLRANGEVSVLRDPSHYQSGNYRDTYGRIVACSSGQRAIIRREQDGEWKVLVDRYQKRRLNSPNDLVVKSDGTIWFTDPPYGLTQPNQGYGGKQEQAGSYVFRFDPTTGEIYPVVTDMERPNGLAFSPDESLLYVSDTSEFDYPQGHHYIRVYQVVDGRYAKNGDVFAEISPGQPDGLRVDEHGNVFTSSQDSIQVYSSDGACLGKILVPETCTNLTFGGQKRNRLFITAGKSLYAIDVNTCGIQ